MIRKENYRDQIRDHLYQSLLGMELRPGQKLSLAAYARRFDTSVTPIREAFTQLEQSGILESVPFVGFCIRKIDREEAREIYGLIALLEGHAIQQAHYSTARLRKLRRAAEQYASESGLPERVRHDNAFHELLCDLNPDSHTARMLRDLKTRVHLHELQFMGDKDLETQADAQHRQMLALAESGAREALADLNHAHWKLSQDFFIEAYDSE